MRHTSPKELMLMPTNKFMGIPQELRELKQWVLWKSEEKQNGKATKVPYTVDGRLASVTEPSDWNSFDMCVARVDDYSGIGFVFTDNDCFSGIDLDDAEGNQTIYERQMKVFKEFDSYSELSPSKSGLHIIVKGSVPSGRRRDKIEVYSSGRFFTMTGSVYNAKPIADRQELLTQLYNQMGGPPKTIHYNGEDKETQNDQEIIEAASSAVNGHKFSELYAGKWDSFYPSQSEADFALVDIIAYYTQNRNQIARIFKASNLGTRKKAQRSDYIDRMILASFDRLPQKIDFDGFRIQLEEKLNENRNEDIPSKISSEVNSSSFSSSIAPPPGLVGDIARFVYETAPRPVPEIAIAAAIGLMAGICGKAYNISKTGLNQYVLLLAPTGTGKEGIAYGIDKLVNAVALSVPVAREFIGPSEIKSGQALIKSLSENPCYVSILGEFGLRLRALSSEKANAAEIDLRKNLLDLYNKSGHGQVVHATIYSDKAKNIAATSAPAFSIIAESVPERFYEVLNEEMISEGLLPRFTLIEYNGSRPKRNRNLGCEPSLLLVDQIANLMANCKTVIANRRFIEVQQSEEALKATDELDDYADEKINGSNQEIIRQLWSRAHVKVLKIAALIAVGCNFHNPVVDVEHIQWARAIVENDIRALSAKFNAGEVGKSSGEMKQINDMKRMIKFFLTQPWDKIKNSFKDERLYHAKLIPHQFITTRLYNMASFKNDKNGAAAAIKRTLQVLVEGDFIREAPKKDMMEKFNTTQRAFVLSSMSLLDDVE